MMPVRTVLPAIVVTFGPQSREPARRDAIVSPPAAERRNPTLVLAICGLLVLAVGLVFGQSVRLLAERVHLFEQIARIVDLKFDFLPGEREAERVRNSCAHTDPDKDFGRLLLDRASLLV